jgi:hypothetical protein
MADVEYVNFVGLICNFICQYPISAFSGGVDSCYTIYRNLIEKDNKWGPEIEAALSMAYH